GLPNGRMEEMRTWPDILINRCARNGFRKVRSMPLARSAMRSVERFSSPTMQAQPCLTMLLVLFLNLSANAQEPSATCKSPIEYGNRNQVDPTRSTVRGLSGRVISEVGDPAKEMG